MSKLLSVSGLRAGYGGASVVNDIDIEVCEGEVVALLGPNGAGKTTTMMTLAGELSPLAGDVNVLGNPAKAPLCRRARRGMALVTEERSVFMRLTVEQNLKLGRASIDRAVAIFPELDPLLRRKAGVLSGGEQQMLTLARALSRNTKLLLADELSLGLAPKTVGRLLRAVRSAADDGMGVLLVEQHVHKVLEIADRVYVLSQGRLEYAGSAENARERIEEIQAHYLGNQPQAE